MNQGITQQQKKLKALIFDMDGVIITTCLLHELAWKQAGEEHGYSWPSTLNFKRDVFGTVSEDSANILFGVNFLSREMDQLITTKDAVYERLLANGVEQIVVPGCIEFLASLKDTGYRIALATSSRKEEAEFVLKALNIFEMFDAVVERSQVTKAKPDPELYLKALSKLDLTPAECIAFEDSLSGVTAVIAAGLRCILVRTTMDEQKVLSNNLNVEAAVDNFLPDELQSIQFLIARESPITMHSNL